MSTEIRLDCSTASDAAGLTTALRHQGLTASVVARDDVMGIGEAIGVTLVSGATLRAFARVACEWVRAHRTTIEVEVEGKGKFTVRGTTDIDTLVALLEDHDG